MKKHLFYTFLSIYAVTAIVTLSALVGLITINDKYLSQLVPALLIETAVAIIALFKGTDFFTDTKETRNILKGTEVNHIKKSFELSSQHNKNIDNTVSSAKTTTTTLEEYFSKYRSLDDRFREQEQYVKSLDGSKVNWNGKVRSVKSYEDTITLFMSSLSEGFGESVIVNFNKEKEIDLFSLRKGDELEVEGILNLEIANSPKIFGLSYKLKIG